MTLTLTAMSEPYYNVGGAGRREVRARGYSPIGPSRSRIRHALGSSPSVLMPRVCACAVSLSESECHRQSVCELPVSGGDSGERLIVSGGDP